MIGLSFSLLAKEVVDSLMGLAMVALFIAALRHWRLKATGATVCLTLAAGIAMVWAVSGATLLLLPIAARAPISLVLMVGLHSVWGGWPMLLARILAGIGAIRLMVDAAGLRPPWPTQPPGPAPSAPEP